MRLKVAFDKDGETKYIVGDRVSETTQFIEVFNEDDEIIAHIPYENLTYVVGVDINIDE